MCLLHYRELLIWAWCGIPPRCRHACSLLGSSRSSRQKRVWEKAGHSLSSSSRNYWVWWQLRPTWYLLACCTWDPYSGGSTTLTEVSLLLVAPFWPGRVWFSDLISLLDGSPWEIPVRRDLLSQTEVLSPTPAQSCGSCGCGPWGGTAHSFRSLNRGC